MVTQLKCLIDDYVELAAELKRKGSALAAVMGNKEDVLHPGHMAFYDAVRCWAEAFCAADPGQETLLQALDVLLLSAQKYEKTAACWYLIAIHEHARPLIARLDEGGREQLLRRYDAAYPPGRRLPLQKQIHQLLGGKKRRYLPFCRPR